MIHHGPCPRIKAIEYHPNGTVKRIEYHESLGIASSGLNPLTHPGHPLIEM